MTKIENIIGKLENLGCICENFPYNQDPNCPVHAL